MKKLYVILVLLFSISISYAQWTTTFLSEGKTAMGACSPTDGEFWFAGGEGYTGARRKVEKYNTDTQIWSFSELSVARSYITGAGGAGWAFFAGGMNLTTFQPSSRIDIYKPTIGWSTAELSVPRFSLSAEIADSTVFFAGGGNLAEGVCYDVVDIYSLSDGSWTTANLSIPRAAMGSAVGHNANGETIIMFAGGFTQQTVTVTDRVDIFNVTRGTWSINSLSEPRGFLAATTVGNKIVIAGGMRNDNTPSNRVDIYNMDTDEWTTSNLSVARAFLDNAATACGKAFFAGGGTIDIHSGIWISSTNVVDIFDPDSAIWTIDYLTNDLVNHAVASDGDHFLVAGGLSFQGGGATANVDIYSCIIIAVDKVEQNQPQYEIFPNPGNGTYYLSRINTDRPEMVDVAVLNMQGALMYNIKLMPDENEFHLNLPAGTYVIKLTGKDVLQAQLVIIQ